jgi:hypothetical protein
MSERATQGGKGPKTLLVRCRHDETAKETEDRGWVGLVPGRIVSRSSLTADDSVLVIQRVCASTIFTLFLLSVSNIILLSLSYPHVLFHFHSFFSVRKIMPHDPPINQRSHHRVRVHRQGPGPDLLSALFSVDSSDITPTPTSVVDSPIAITVSVTSTNTPLSSTIPSVAQPCTCLCLPRMHPN